MGNLQRIVIVSKSAENLCNCSVFAAGMCLLTSIFLLKNIADQSMVSQPGLEPNTYRCVCNWSEKTCHAFLGAKQNSCVLEGGRFASSSCFELMAPRRFPPWFTWFKNSLWFIRPDFFLKTVKKTRVSNVRYAVISLDLKCYQITQKQEPIAGEFALQHENQ